LLYSYQDAVSWLVYYNKLMDLRYSLMHCQL